MIDRNTLPPPDDWEPPDLIAVRPAEAGDDPIAWMRLGADKPETAVKFAQLLQVVNDGTASARLYIDGELFAYATANGFDVHTGGRRHAGALPAVTLTIVAAKVELLDSLPPRSASEAASNA